MEDDRGIRITCYEKKRDEQVFDCAKLNCYLTTGGITDWDVWHQAHIDAQAGKCIYKDSCQIYAKTKAQIPLICGRH